MNELDCTTSATTTAETTEEKELTLVEAFDKILSVACHSELEEKELAKEQEAFDYLQAQLDITRMQALIIAMLIDSNDRLHTKNMANYLSISNIKFLRHSEELQDLVGRKIVREGKERNDNSMAYEIREEAQQAFMANHQFVAPKYENLSVAEFVELLRNLFDKCSDESISRQELQHELQEITQQNQHLYLCKEMDSLAIPEMIFFYYCVSQLVWEGDTSISTMEITEFTNPLAARKLNTMLLNEKSDLKVRNLIRNSGDSGFNNRDSFTVSDTISERLVADFDLKLINDAEKASKELLKHDTITAKTLFYNKEEKRSIDELTEILMPQKFCNVQRRLAEHGMRKGFACLFYGAPGTGKTETVLQLSRATGRDIMEVNIADIRSKWVGDSEKNIKQIFSRYRSYCQMCSPMPILLFNEADAIISKRGTNVEKSVEKMENAIQNIILEEMEKLDGILIATTNLTSNMDAAFERRFLYKVEFKKPEILARTKIWQSMINDLREEDAYTLAKTYDFSGGQIENIARKEIINNILHDGTTSFREIRDYCDTELLHPQGKNRNPIGFC